MTDIKQNFPIFKNNPGLIYLDNTATVQKPSIVIDGIKNYLENDYSNIHRGFYDISEKSEQMYIKSKKKVAENIGASSWKEVIYTYNSTYASNILISSLRRSNYFKAGDKVLLSIVEHHANIVPWLILKEEIGIEIEYIKIKGDFSLDLEDLKSKLDSKVKAISITHVSNVTGEIFDLKGVHKILNEKYNNTPPSISPLLKEGSNYNKPLFIVDTSQSIPHIKLNVKEIGCDALFFTGHKMMSDSGIGVLWGKEKLLENLKPAFSGGGAISWVKEDSFKEAAIPDRFEPGTPNLSGAISVLKAFEYIENIGGYNKIEEIEINLNKYTLERFKSVKGVKLIGGSKPNTKASVFSFVVDGIHSLDIADFMAEHNICIRSGQHCAEPFLSNLGINHTCRMSLYIYNTTEDIDKFFEVLEKAINELK